MYKDIDYVYDAIVHFEQVTGMKVEVESSRKEYDAIVSIQDVQFVVVAKLELRTSNHGIVLSDLKDKKENSKRPIIVVAKFIASDIANDLKDRRINYIDGAGNAFIEQNQFHVFVSGQKSIKENKVKQARAFQEAGIKLLFKLLTKPENLQLSYRRLAEEVGISIGSVSNIINELEELNFILKTNSKRILKNKTDLLQRWVVAYHDVLRPRLLKKRMRFAKIEQLNNWESLPIHETEDICLWGSEPAAAIMTGYLRPDQFTIYTDANWQSFVSKFGLVPDEDGDVEILQMFWYDEIKDRETAIVPSLLVYADLISSGLDRNIETAKMIFENDLQYIK